MDIFDLVVAKEIATYYLETASNRIPYLGATLFPSKKQLGLGLAWIKGGKGLPVALAPSAFDAKASLRDRIGVSKIETEMPFFREAMRIGEKDRQQINNMSAAANAAALKPIVAKIFDDATQLVAGAQVQAERMRMQLLSTGEIAITEKGMPYTYDFRFPAAHRATLLTTARWSDFENSNPVTDILKWQDLVEDDTGNRPNRAVCSRKTWGYLLENKRIRLDMNPVGGQNIIVTDALLKAYLLNKLQLRVEVYSKKYALEVGGSSAPFFPDDVFTLIPDGSLGSTYFGTTPEESDLMSGKSRAKVEIVDTGVAVTTYTEEHPVNIVTVVSAITMPSFEAIDSVFIARVHS